jgi:hypothetical protein
MHMKTKPPFLEDDEGHPISRTVFRRMRKGEKRELMLRWFGRNFEDPAEHTSYISAEGGYVWNHGGPYDAKDELYGMFGDIVPEKLIDEVVAEVQSEGIYDWAGTAEHENEYPDYDEEPPERSPFDSYSDRPTEQFGSQKDWEERRRILSGLHDVLDALDKQRPVGIGHNNPPEEIGESYAVEEVRSNATAMQFELQKASPSIALVKRLGSALYRAAGASIKWVGGKLDRIVDKLIDEATPLAVATVGLAYHEPLMHVLEATLRWLAIVAHTVF